MPTTYVLNQIFRGSGPEVVRCRSPQAYLPYKCRPRVEHDDIDDNMAIVAQITRTLFTRRIFKLQRRFLFFCASAEKFFLLKLIIGSIQLEAPVIFRLEGLGLRHRCDLERVERASRPHGECRQRRIYTTMVHA
ncbi:unnamed protein product [Sphagnum jensenii]|jgi:hypothetical protein